MRRWRLRYPGIFSSDDSPSSSNSAFHSTRWCKIERVKGQHVCITGGSEGIGKAIAEECVRRGAKGVTLMARTEDKLRNAIASLKEIIEEMKTAQISKEYTRSDCEEETNGGTSNGRKCNREYRKECFLSYQCVNVGNSEEVALAFARASSTVSGTINVLFCCAGMAQVMALAEQSNTQIRLMHEVNILGVIFCVKEVLPAMQRQRHGTIVLFGSESSVVAIYGYSTYAASKYAVRGFAEALDMEVRPYGISVCTVYPPSVDTPGYALENVTKPKITKIIEDTTGLRSASEIASSVLNHIEKGHRRVFFGFLGHLLSIVSASFGPVNSLRDWLLEVLCGGFIRGIALCFLLHWHRLKWTVRALGGTRRVVSKIC